VLHSEKLIIPCTVHHQ